MIENASKTFGSQAEEPTPCIPCSLVRGHRDNARQYSAAPRDQPAPRKETLRLLSLVHSVTDPRLLYGHPILTDGGLRPREIRHLFKVTIDYPDLI